MILLTYMCFCTSSLLLVLAVASSVEVGRGATEVLKNPDFENTNIGHDWHANGNVRLTSSRDSYHDNHSVYVSNRHHQWEGPRQDVQVTPDKNYNFVGYIKFVSLPIEIVYDTAELWMNCVTPTKPHDYIMFGNIPFTQVGIWSKVGGIARVPHGAHSCNVYVQVKNPGTDYVLDNMSLQEFPEDPTWRTEAETRINNIRKADITVKLNGPHAQQYDVELKQTSHEFAFGTAVGASQMVDLAYKNYQNFILNNFNWAVLENALKWTQLERTHNHVDYSKALAAIHALRNGGIKIRAHNLVWGFKSHSPAWLPHLSNSQIKTEFQDHIADAVRHTQGLVEHWDVNNECLHGDWFEQVTQDPNITMKMFSEAHRIDPNVKLFLNDYSVVTGAYTLAMRNQAKLFKDAGVPIYGVGIQSHVHNSHPDMTVYKKRLDTVAEAGLPIWITELTVKDSNSAAKAAALRDLLTLYFSHPAVEGVLLWGFWDGKIYDKTVALFEGPNVTPNAAGQVWLDLYHTTWRTDEHHTVAGDGTVTVRGFRGQYQLTVRHQGHQIARETFPVHAAGKAVTVNLGSGGANVIVG